MSIKKRLKFSFCLAFAAGMMISNIALAGTVIIISNQSDRSEYHRHHRPQYDYDQSQWPYYPDGNYYPPPPPPGRYGGYPPGYWQQPPPNYYQNNNRPPPRRDFQRLPSTR